LDTEPTQLERFSYEAYQERRRAWILRSIEWPAIDYFDELWRDPREEPDLLALAERDGEEKAFSAAGVHLFRMYLLREVLTAASGLLYTLAKIETIFAELQAVVNERVEPWQTAGERHALDENTEFKYAVTHPLVADATFEFVNFLSWLRALDERLDRPHGRDRTPRVGLLPALSDRPPQSRINVLVTDFRNKALERKLANYVLHAGIVPDPTGGAAVSHENRVGLPIPDRPRERVTTHWHLTYEEERDALPLARDAARAVESLVDGLLAALEEEARAVEVERGAG
jgi:hypothetical protein